MTCVDDGKLQAEGDSGEFWVIFGGFAPIGKKVASDDDIVLEKTAPKLYWYSFPSMFMLIDKSYKKTIRIAHHYSCYNLQWCFLSIADGQVKDVDGELSKSLLENNKCYLLDCGSEVFVWVGRVTQVEERKAAVQVAEVGLGFNNFSCVSARGGKIRRLK